MPEYQVELLDHATHDFSRLDGVIRRRVWKRLEWLRQNFDTITPEALTANLVGLYKLRVGDYRVVYEVIRGEGRIVIHSIGHRRDVYRRP